MLLAYAAGQIMGTGGECTYIALHVATAGA
jgi:hypothetical protein